MGLNCPLCEKDYTTGGELQPRLLIGCGHTFCRKCLDDRKLPDGRTECPHCSLISTEPHAPNITLMKFVDVQSPKQCQVMHPVSASQRTMCQGMWVYAYISNCVRFFDRFLHMHENIASM